MTPHRCLSTGIAFALLVLQVIAGGMVTLAEAGEPLAATRHIEAQHEAGCPVLHDALRCALCHYAGSRVVVQQTPAPASSRPARRGPVLVDAPLALSAGVHRQRNARAPPVPLS